MQSSMVGGLCEEGSIGLRVRERADGDADERGGPQVLGLSIGTNPTVEEVEDDETTGSGFSHRVVGYWGSSYAEMKVLRRVKQPQVGGGVRKPCEGFSRGSRRSMQRLVSQLKTSSVCKGLFVTLTYPADFPDGGTAKRHLDTFIKRLKRHYPDVGGLWKLEPQERGAPHFHLILLGVEFIPHKWISTAWYEIVNSGDGRHLSAGTEVRRVKSYKHAVRYVSKYVAKPTDTFGAGDGLGEVGRRWGKFGAWQSHLGEVMSLALNPREAAQLARALDKKRLANARAISRPHSRRRAISRARRRRTLDFSQYWLGSPDVVLFNVMKIIGRSD